ncbi:chemotaxis protein CheB [Paracoccus sp. S-4012]|uniref:chemotaxis protein CheB n=1 Tax=Paracoccus sp. S-4012 TaxID=2665648 RepID=UPI0012AF22F2|nr:chemotaxis protein CheB [Paracoccus sp. S-4012]MRX52305.1 chemotaxis protein CheB [Paracoccus sp. S-4012]
MARSAVIAIGASAGGVSALRSLAAALPETFAAPILVVLHVGAHRSELPELLSAVGPMPAKHAEDDEAFHPGNIYVAPPDRHMIVAEGRLRLLRTPKENWARPAIDPLFRSVAESYGPNAAGVILTGNLNDGTLGLLEIKRRGGITVVQNPRDAAHPEMPRSAAVHVSLDHCLPLVEIPELLVELTTNRKEADMPITSTQPGAVRHSAENNGWELERPVAVTCPDCGGALKRSVEGSIVKFGCHIGHSYTAEVMASAHFDELERVMRAAVRFLNERAEFCLQMAEHSQSTGFDDVADWHAASQQALDRAYKLRDLVEQDWITPETNGRLASASGGRDPAGLPR